MQHDLETLWKELEGRYGGDEGVYRRLDLGHEIGIRMAVLSPGRTWAILIEISPEDASVLAPPRWRGMGFKVIPLTGPEPGTKHICLFVENPEHRSVFTSLCSDIIRTLESSDRTSRVKNLQQCFHRWSKFFERWGQEGLTQERQRGLFGELEFLEMMLESGLSPIEAVSSWKGCTGGVHDFVRLGRAVEVKTTISKEPRKISVSSERQLDDADLQSLSLFILTLHEMDAMAMTLPDAVSRTRQLLEKDTNAASFFEAGLIAAGYVDSDADKYPKCYAIRKREAFGVRNGFPRIVTISPGVGDLQYTVTVSACGAHEIAVDAMLYEFTGSVKHEQH